MTKKKVYLLEDDADIYLLVQMILTGYGYDVAHFSTVAAFRKQITLALPDIIILDILLPDGNGLDVCRELSENDPTASVPILLVSGYPENQVKYKAAGAWAFISKPFSSGELLDKVNKLFAA